VVKAIGWNMAERGKALAANTVCSLAFHPAINEWNGRREVQLEVRDFRLDEVGDHARSPLQPA
jgi:single-stranded-DNA-specific exonuclease